VIKRKNISRKNAINTPQCSKPNSMVRSVWRP